jgi:hypothetical protein
MRDAPLPDQTENHRSGYAWRQRGFSHIQVLARGEGSAVYSVTGEGSYWIIKDQGTLADFLGPDDEDLLESLIVLERYEGKERWLGAIDAIVSRERQRFQTTPLRRTTVQGAAGRNVSTRDVDRSTSLIVRWVPDLRNVVAYSGSYSGRPTLRCISRRSSASK